MFVEFVLPRKNILFWRKLDIVHLENNIKQNDKPTSTPQILIYPDPNKPYFLFTDLYKNVRGQTSVNIHQIQTIWMNLDQ